MTSNVPAGYTDEGEIDHYPPRTSKSRYAEEFVVNCRTSIESARRIIVDLLEQEKQLSYKISCLQEELKKLRGY